MPRGEPSVAAMAGRGRRERLIRGARAQVFGHAVRVVIQVAGVLIFTSFWGLHLYGEWLILTAIPTYLAFSDMGFVTAVANDMTMAVGRGDRDHALAIYRAVARLLALVLAVLAVVLPALALALPLAGMLNLSVIGESTAGLIVVALGFDALLAIYASLLYGGYACEGRYGEGAFAIAAISLVEFLALAAVVIGGAGPGTAAVAMLAGRASGTVAMWLVMRRYAPWLTVGPGAPVRRLLGPLFRPALASGAFPLGFALNLQGMTLMIGVAAGPVSAAIFSTLRTLSRLVIQLLASVNAVISPEISKAYGAGDAELLRSIHRRGCQVALWAAGVIVVFLALMGGPILNAWTGGKVDPAGSVLNLLLLVAVIDSFWYASAAVLVATNRHQRIAIDYVAASVVTVPVAYVLLEAMGLPGAALALVGLELFMAQSVLRRALPLAGDTLADLARAVRTPPLEVLRGVVGMPRKTRGAAP